ncbi:MAG: hypothetical protein K8S98_15465 [Planctomycetes bacterium]|nr:hypothetical protein [Planctomycetota bacterium]
MPQETMTAGWNEFRSEVLALPDRIGTRLATEANAADALAAALAASDAFELLKLLDETEAGPFENLVGDASAFAKLFECKSGGGGVVDGAALAREQRPDVVDGTELRHPAGVQRVDLNKLNRGTKFPRCLVVRGAGIDRTLLVWETLRTRDRVERIELSDLTLFATNVFDLRHDFATIVLERVRVVGFDCGAGSSAAFDTHGNALLARDCRIEGGYGRGPGDGRLFDVRTPALLARFENCVLSRVAIEARLLRERSTVVFDHCAFLETTEPSETFVSPPRGLVLVACRATSPNGDDDSAQLDLNDLFPGWRQAR